MIHKLDCTALRARLIRRYSARFSAMIPYAVASFVFALPVTARAQQATFTPLGRFGGFGSIATDVSADGSVIVGATTPFPGSTASVFRLTPQGSEVRSGFGGYVSADGSTVVGAYISPNGQEAFRWVGDAPFEPLGDLPGGDFISTASGVSADGSVVVGSGQTESGRNAYRWTAASTMMALGTNERQAGGVSADGSVVVGSLRVGQDPSLAYRWTAQTGSISLPTLARPQFPLFGAAARAVSADGSVVVGYNEFRASIGTTDQEAFRWTQQEGTTSLQAAGWLGTDANDVSADGSAVVGWGYSRITGSPTAFYWTPDSGMLDLRELLIFGGATNLDGWNLTLATGISADGRTVVGEATSPDGRQAFVATIGAIPEPPTIVLSALAVAGMVALVRMQGMHIRRVPSRGAVSLR